MYTYYIAVLDVTDPVENIYLFAAIHTNEFLLPYLYISQLYNDLSKTRTNETLTLNTPSSPDNQLILYFWKEISL